jgi:hypothetical protein
VNTASTSSVTSFRAAIIPAYRRTAPVALEVAALTAILVVAWLVLPPVFLPALCLVSLTVAAAVALYTRQRRAPDPAVGLTCRDVIGGLVFLGFAAGMLSKPDQVLQLFGQAT